MVCRNHHEEDAGLGLDVYKPRDHGRSVMP